MQSEYAMAISQQPRRKTRRKAHRRVGSLKPALFLAAVILSVPTIWWGLTGNVISSPYRPVEMIFQNPELPNGCEITSAAMVLTSAGCPADKLALYQDCLPKADFSYVEAQRYGPSPEKWYVGNAADLKGGWYCFEGPVVQAANQWLENHGNGLRARSLTGLTKAELDRYAQEEVPLVVWVTLGYAAPQQNEFSWTLEDGTVYHPYSNLHCVVLTGAEEGQYRVADPLAGFALVDKDLFWDSFSAMGCRAVIIK